MKLFRLVFLSLLFMALAPASGFAADGNSPAPKAEKSADKAEAKDKKDQKKDSKDGGDAKPKDDGLFASQDNLVPLPTIIAPVLYNDRLISHLYIYLAVVTKDASDAQQVKMRIPYIQDALVRDVNDNLLALSDPSSEPDTKPMIARFKGVIDTAIGKPLVTDIQVGRVDTAPY